MSANPRPEEPNVTAEPVAEGDQAEARAPENNEPQGGAATEAVNTSGQADEGAEQADASAVEAPSLEARVAELEAQVSDLTDRLLRAHAELDNFRKRTEREKADLAKYAISKFAADIVVLGDNFQRAVAAVPADAAERDATLKGMLEGINMMDREFLNVLARHGVKRVDPDGQPFNPHLHQAVMEQQNPDVPSGTVVQVFQPGYTIEDRVLRPAMVVVSTGGPKQKPAEKQAEQAHTTDSSAVGSAEPAAEANGAAEPGSEANPQQ